MDAHDARPLTSEPHRRRMEEKRHPPRPRPPQRPGAERIAEHEAHPARKGKTRGEMRGEAPQHQRVRQAGMGRAPEEGHFLARDHHPAQGGEIGERRTEAEEIRPQFAPIEWQRLKDPPAQTRPRRRGIVVGIMGHRAKPHDPLRLKRRDRALGRGEKRRPPSRKVRARHRIEVTRRLCPVSLAFGRGEMRISRRPDHAPRYRRGPAPLRGLLEQRHPRPPGGAVGRRRQPRRATAHHHQIERFLVHIPSAPRENWPRLLFGPSLSGASFHDIG